MDGICEALLEKINAQAGVGRYVVYSEDELFECFPDGAEQSDGELRKALRALISEGYVDMKYASGNMFCVAPLKKYVPEEPSREEYAAPVVADADQGNVRTVLLPFLAAFTGGMAGSLLISLLFALL